MKLDLEARSDAWDDPFTLIHVLLGGMEVDEASS